MSKSKINRKDCGAREIVMSETITEREERKFEYERVALKKIEVKGQSVREAVNDDHVVELSLSMQKNGLLEPIVLQKKSKENYQLIAGFHRLTAAHRLDWETIPSHIIIGNVANIKALALIENVVRKDMSLKEECDAVAYLVATEKLSTSQMCDLLGKSRPWVDRRLVSLNLPEDLKGPLFDGILPAGHAELLGGIEDEAQRKWLTSWALQNRPPKSALAEMVNTTLNTPNISDAVEIGLAKAQEISKTSPFLRTCQSCMQHVDMTELVCVWIHKNGCPEPIKENEKKEP